MRKGRAVSVLVLLLVVLTASASATSVINSDDWRTVVLAQNIADLRGEETFTVATPEDARIAAQAIEEPETLYLGESPVVSDLEQRTGLNFTRTVRLPPEEREDASEGFVVVKDGFGTDAVSMLPYANSMNYSLVFYSSVREELGNSTLPKVFYGEFDFEPEDRFENARHIEGSWQERNLAVAEEMDSDWAVLTSRGYFDPEAIGESPVLFKMWPKRLAEFIDSSGIRNIKVVGAENAVYAKGIDLLTDRDLGIVVKTGRAFTGISGLDGVYGVKSIETPYRRYDLDMTDIYLGHNYTRAAVKFVNRGNTLREVELRLAANRTRNASLLVPEFSTVTYSFNVSRSDQLQVNYTTERSTGGEVLDWEKVPRSRISPVTSLRPVKSNYSEQEKALKVALENSGEREVWAMLQSSGQYKRVEVEPGETTAVVLEDVERSDSYTVFQGIFENQYSYSNQYSVGEEGSLGIWVVLLAAVVVLPSFYVVYEFIS